MEKKSIDIKRTQTRRRVGVPSGFVFFRIRFYLYVTFWLHCDLFSFHFIAFKFFVLRITSYVCIFFGSHTQNFGKKKAMYGTIVPGKKMRRHLFLQTFGHNHPFQRRMPKVRKVKWKKTVERRAIH